MKIGSIRCLGCVGVGLVLGFVAAHKDLIPPSKAVQETPATARPSVTEAAVGCETKGEPPSCCPPGMNKGNLLRSLKAETAMKRLQELEGLSPPRN